MKTVVKFLLATLIIFSTLLANESVRFAESFLNCYDFSIAGRNTHEYHTLLLEKSSHSLDELEDEIEKGGMNIKGRIVLTGYEEQSIPAFYTSYKNCTGSKINDEAYVKSKSDWTSQLHNKFGLLTGFLFKDCNLVKQYYFPESEFPFEHIDVNLISIYDNDAYFFQKHPKAFGNLITPMQYKKQNMDQLLIQKNHKGIFSELINFWKYLYGYEMLQGNQNVMGTQDILFSISHAQHLFRSKVDLIKYYLGPDITYPIKVTKKQKKPATKHAQEFVKRFVKQLKPIDEEPTVYVFCSFVDGVGKSTLLGNIINYQNNQTNFENYKAVDNSSSQLADIYEYGENVFIADLPAQVSHFTYKPDGMVYIDLQTIKDHEEELKKTREVIAQSKEELIQNHENLVAHIQTIVEKNGWFASEVNDKNQPEKSFIKNTLLLNQDCSWITFRVEDKSYIFDKENPTRIKILCEIEKADSTGLKNIDPAQMLFFEGVRFPVSYELFVQNLVGELQKRGIQNVVLVDFMSMYPRSSRENIRVNYLLQQLSIIYPDFDIEKSLYGTFNNDAQLFAKLKMDKQHRTLDALQKETTTRLALFNIINRQNYSSIDGVQICDVTKILQEEIAKINTPTKRTIEQKSREKLKLGLERLEKVHGLTKNFINIQELDFDEIIKLSKKLKKIFTQKVECKNLNELWNIRGKIIEITKDDIVRTSKGETAKLLYSVSPECKNENILAPILRTIRASWYSSLFNLIDGKINSGKISVEKERYFIPPVLVKKTKDGKIAIIRKIIEEVDTSYLSDDESKKMSDETKETLTILRFPQSTTPEYGKYEDKFYLLNFEKGKTDAGVLSFCYDPQYTERYELKNLNRDTSQVITIKEMWDVGYYSGKYVEEDKKYYLEQIKKCANGVGNNSQYYKNFKTPEEKEYHKFRLLLRAAATLEMLIKDANSKIVIRRNNKEDFSTAIQFFENVMMMHNLKLVFEKNLFDDYNMVKPLVKLSPE